MKRVSNARILAQRTRQPLRVWLQAVGVLFVHVALTCGCNSPAPPTPPSVATNEPEAKTDVPVVDQREVTAGTTTATDKTAGTALEASTKKVSPAGAPPTQTKKQPAPEPTAEQLASWMRSPFEPIQLLACREWDKIGFVAKMASTPDGRQYILAGSKVTLWSLTSTEPEHVFLDLASSGTERSVKSLAIAPDGRWFAVGDSEGKLQIWSLTDRKELVSKQLYDNDVIDIAISPDSQEIATLTYTNEVTVWSADKLEQKTRFKVESSNLQRIAYLASGQLVAAAETTTLWNVPTGQLEQTLSPGRFNYTLSRSPTGKWFAFGSREGLHIRNISDSKDPTTLPGGFATDELVAFSPDERFVATANQFAIRIWDLASRQVVQVIDAYGWAKVGLSWLPESQLLLVATEDGRVRLWGTPAAGEPLTLRPMHAAIRPPDTSSRAPLTPTQLLDAIDLRSFPLLPESVTQVHDVTTLYGEAPVTVEEAKLFYRYFLGKNGWSEIGTAPSMPDALQFQKNGCLLSATFTRSDESKSTISLNSFGNYDLRWAPRFDAAPVELDFESEHAVMYRTKANLVEIETSLLRRMHEAGWTAYSRLHSSYHEQTDARDLNFLQNSVMLSVSIGRSPADPTSYTVRYTRFLTTNSLPVPRDCGFIEFDGSTQPQLVALSKLGLAQTWEFYDRAMVEQGWLPREIGRSLKEDRGWLPFIQGQKDLTIGFLSHPSGGTLVLVGKQLENASWQLAKPKPVEPAAEAVGMEAADFPILNASKSAKYDANAKSIEISMGAVPLLEVADRYTRELEPKGWKTGDRGIRADDYVFLTFEQKDAEIELRARVTDGQAVVNIQGDGLLWTKPLPGGKQVISYETWLRNNHHPATLELLDEYLAEMKSLATSATSATK